MNQTYIIIGLVMCIIVLLFKIQYFANLIDKLKKNYDPTIEPNEKAINDIVSKLKTLPYHDRLHLLRHITCSTATRVLLEVSGTQIKIIGVGAMADEDSDVEKLNEYTG